MIQELSTTNRKDQEAKIVLNKLEKLIQGMSSLKIHDDSKSKNLASRRIIDATESNPRHMHELMINLTKSEIVEQHRDLKVQNSSFTEETVLGKRQRSMLNIEKKLDCRKLIKSEKNHNTFDSAHQEIDIKSLFYLMGPNNNRLDKLIEITNLKIIQLEKSKVPEEKQGDVAEELKKTVIDCILNADITNDEKFDKLYDYLMEEFDRDDNRFDSLLLNTMTKIESEFEFKDKEFECWERFILVPFNCF